MSKLDPEFLVTTAQQQAGLIDFGDAELSSLLARLCTSLVEEAHLSELGTQAVQADLIRMLVNRLRMQAALVRHPEICEQSLMPPIVILGLPRTGTTKLQRMLSVDPGVQALHFWRMRNPAPFPETKAGDEDPRIAEAERMEALMREYAPRLLAAHPFLAREADEEAFLMLASFRGSGVMMQAKIPYWSEWLAGEDLKVAYRLLRTMLQFLQWQDGARSNAPWIMKSPMHIGHLDSLLNVFPGALVVQCHRDPSEALPSFAGLVEQVRLQFSSRVDRHELGDFMVRTMGWHMSRHMRQVPDVDTRILDFGYREIVTEPMRVIRQIYRAAERELTPEAEQQMRRWELGNAQHKHGKHVYSLADYGMSKKRVDEEFAEYIERYGSYWLG